MKIAQMLALAILLGSVPFERLAAKPGRTAAAAMSALSAAMGFVPVFLARRALVADWIVCVVGAVAIASHCFPYWLMFRPNGRGMATSAGVLAGMNLAAGAAALGVWALAKGLLHIAGNRSSGLMEMSDAAAIIIAGISAPIWLRAFGAGAVFIRFSLLGCAYVIISHSVAFGVRSDCDRPTGD